MPTRRLPPAIFAGLLVLTGCGASSSAVPAVPGTSRSAATAPGSTPTGPTAPGTTPAAPAAPGTAYGEAVTLAFAGDVHFEGSVRKWLGDPAGLVGPLAGQLRAADLAVVNLETPITDRGEPATKKYVFRGPEAGLRGLLDAGVDMVSLANNHGLDYGRTGLLDTLDAGSRAGLSVIGAGRDQASAYAPHRVTVKDQRIAVIGATQVLDGDVKESSVARGDRPGLASAYEIDTLVEAVRQARATSDTVVVFLHWGVERNDCPPQRARELATRLVEAGADVLVGSHAHVLNGDGWSGPAYVHYGLGNFLWYHGSGPSAATGVLTLTVQGRATTRAHWEPATIVQGQPRPLGGPARQEALQQREQLRPCTGLTPTPG